MTDENARRARFAEEQGRIFADALATTQDALAGLMRAYERLVRSACTPEEIAREPWRCMEFVAAEAALAPFTPPREEGRAASDPGREPVCPDCGETPSESNARWARIEATPNYDPEGAPTPCNHDPLPKRWHRWPARGDEGGRP